MKNNISTYFDRFKNYKVIVVGDVMTDSYIVGKVNRISPEAPVPVVNLTEKESRLGGAANVALNIAALDAEAILCSVIGKDEEGNAFIKRAEKRNISCDGIVQSEKRKTTVKTRIIAQNQQLLRVDEEENHLLSPTDEDLLLSKFKTLVDQQKIDAVIFEDYNKGVLTSKVIEKITAICNQKNIITTVDPKKDQFFDYLNVTLFKPNLKELREGIDESIQWGSDSFINGIKVLEEQLNNKITLVTLSEQGVFVKNGDESYHIKAHVRNISDVSGAGDTVISTATLCLVADVPVEKMAAIANLAGGIVCEEIGVVPINKEKLILEAQKYIEV